MKIFGIDRKSIKSRVRQSTLFVLMVQVLLFSVIIAGGGTISNLSEEYFKVFEGKVISRSKYLEDAMINQWSALDGFERDIQKEVLNFNVLNSTKTNLRFWEKMMERTTQTLRQQFVTGAFFIMDNNSDQEGIYLRDLDPLANPLDNSDIMILRGPAEYGENLRLSLDHEWAHKFDLKDDQVNSDYYYKPFRAAIHNPALNSKELGYWSKPFKHSENDIEVITYSIPLRNREGNPYAVIGIELSLDYLKNSLYYKELADDKQGGYLLALKEEQPGSFKNIVTSGPILKRYIGQNKKTSFALKKDHQDVYLMENKEEQEGTVYASIQYLTIYGERSPFKMDHWALVGMVGEKDLFRPIHTLWLSIALALLFSLAVGMITVYITGEWFVRPVTKLVTRVLESNPSNQISLSKTNISEIDELALAIESLSTEVAGSSSKLSQIISMVNIPIGAFEYDLREKKAFCTDTMFEILKIEREDMSIKNIKASYLKEILTDLIERPEPKSENVYSYPIEGEPMRWIRMKTQQNNGKVIGIIEDVTKDIQAKRKIEYERDHDVLTQLLNRRAFNVKVKEILEEGIANAAFVMWDLDNLKYINDTYGHDQGDEYIKAAASVLATAESYKSIVARMSGDEFYTFIYDYEDKEEIRRIIKEIRQKLHTSLLTMPDGTIFRIRASGGIAWYPDDSRTYDQLIKYSDFAMYQIKHSDKGSVGEFNKSTYEKDSILLYGREDLNQFIEKELVIYNFQPIVDARTAKVFAYESLMRPQLVNIKSPVDIIRLAKSQSKLYDIERITLFKAMEAFEDYQEAFGDAKIFINSIPNYVLSHEDLMKFEDKHREYLDRIVVEIIENEQSNEKSTQIKKDIVAKWGSDLALDDFGSGYNNEMVLLILSPKYIKIDRAIVSGIDQDKNRQELFKNIVSYTKFRDIKVIAEGIETKAEMHTVIRLGADYLQGYYLGMPELIPQPIDQKIIKEILI